MTLLRSLHLLSFAPFPGWRDMAVSEDSCSLSRADGRLLPHFLGPLSFFSCIFLSTFSPLLQTTWNSHCRLPHPHKECSATTDCCWLPTYIPSFTSLISIEYSAAATAVAIPGDKHHHKGTRSLCSKTTRS